MKTIRNMVYECSQQDPLGGVAMIKPFYPFVLIYFLFFFHLLVLPIILCNFVNYRPRLYLLVEFRSISICYRGVFSCLVIRGTGHFIV